MWSFVEEHCPSSISKEVCSCSVYPPEQGAPASCGDPETYALEECCPDEDLCEAGTEASCPYSGCRRGVLELLLDFITPVRNYSIFAFILEGGILVLTCLLICYNPRDSTEDILVKTGAVVRASPQEPGLAQGRDEQLAVAGEKVLGAKDGTNLGKCFVQPGAVGLEVARVERARSILQKEENLARSTPASSPITKDIPVEPLRQFMTPRVVRNRVVYGAVSPGSPGVEAQELDNAVLALARPNARAGVVSSSGSTAPKTVKRTAAPTTREGYPRPAPSDEGGDCAIGLIRQRAEEISSINDEEKIRDPCSFELPSRRQQDEILAAESKGSTIEGSTMASPPSAYTVAAAAEAVGASPPVDADPPTVSLSQIEDGNKPKPPRGSVLSEKTPIATPQGERTEPVPHVGTVESAEEERVSTSQLLRVDEARSTKLNTSALTPNQPTSTLPDPSLAAKQTESDIDDGSFVGVPQPLPTASTILSSTENENRCAQFFAQTPVASPHSQTGSQDQTQPSGAAGLQSPNVSPAQPGVTVAAITPQEL
ncbi:unnamed protein product [Ascophyllum nodosum]